MSYSTLKTLLSTVIIWFSCLLISSSFAADTISVEDYVKNQKLIRVLADNGPGYGNLAAAVNIMIRLRQLGFQGPFEVIYGDTSQHDIVDIFDLPADVADDYFDVKNNVRFIKLSSYYQQLQNKQAFEVAGLGVTADFYENPCAQAVRGAASVQNELAYDAYLHLRLTDPNTNYPPYIQPSAADYQMATTLTCRNFANFLNAKMFMNITNFPGIKGLHYFDVTSADIFSFNNEQYYKIDVSNTYLVIPPAGLQQVKDYLKDHPRGQALLQQKPGLNTFIAGIEAKQFNVMPIYGFTLHDYDNWDGQNLYVGNMLQVITAARFAQLNGPTEYRNKPLILAVFYNIEKEEKIFDQLIHNDQWGDKEEPGADNARAAILSLGLRDDGVFTYASLADADLTDKINHLKPGQILLLSMGQLPKVVFDGLYTYTGDNVFPQIREGLSSLSSLLLTGKPHFRCTNSNWITWELGFDGIKDNALKEKFIHFYFSNMGFCHGMQPWEANSLTYQTLGQFIIEAHDPASALSLYFQSLKTKIEKQKHDRVYATIEKMIKIQNGDVSGSIANLVPAYTPPKN